MPFWAEYAQWGLFAAGFLALAIWLLVLFIRFPGWSRLVSGSLLAFVTFVLWSASVVCGSQAFGFEQPSVNLCAPELSFFWAPLGFGFEVLSGVLYRSPVGSS